MLTSPNLPTVEFTNVGRVSADRAAFIALQGDGRYAVKLRLADGGQTEIGRWADHSYAESVSDDLNGALRSWVLHALASPHQSGRPFCNTCGVLLVSPEDGCQACGATPNEDAMVSDDA